MHINDLGTITFPLSSSLIGEENESAQGITNSFLRGERDNE